MKSVATQSDPTASQEATARVRRLGSLVTRLGLYALSAAVIIGGVFLVLVVGRMAGVSLLHGDSMSTVVFLSLAASVFGVHYAGMRLGLFDGWF